MNYLKQYLGIKEGSAEHRAILNVFNDSKLCKRYTMTVNDAWCATGVSAAFIATGLANIFPCVECSCPEMINLAKKAGIWIEDDSITPEVGYVIMYDWQDSGAGDNKGVADHVGIVSEVNGKQITVIECNKNDSVAYRTLQVNGQYIRGYISPKYPENTSKPEPEKPATPSTPSTGGGLNKTSKWIGKVTASSLNVRSWAGTENETCSFSPLKKNTKVDVCDSVKAKDGSTWYYICYAGKYGFVHSDYISK